MSDPWLAWGELAGREWAHTVSIAGQEPLSDVNSLEEEAPGRYAWVEEEVFRTPGGIYLFLRRARREDRPDELILIAGRDPDELVSEIKAQLGMPPGRIETLGRAGIEIGIAPDDEIEGDELEGPIP